MMIRAILLVTTFGLLAGCAQVTAPDPFLTQSVESEAPTLASDVSSDFAAAYLPSLAGGIQSVRQSVAKDKLHQEIIYTNLTGLAGENVLTVDVNQPVEGQFLRPPSQTQIWNEMRSLFPGVKMSVSSTIRDNVNGVYGYATGTYNTTGACIYAWQRVKKVTPADSSGFDRFTRVHLAASVRLRYCHPSISADRIHVLMDGLRVKDMNSQTIDMLRFASGSADSATPVAIVKPVAVVMPRKKTVRRAVEVPDDDWRKDAAKPIDKGKSPDFIDNAATVPLPDDGAVTVPVDGTSTDEQVRIRDAAPVPLPE